MANSFGFAVLFMWPFLAALALCRLPLAAGIPAAVIGGYLFLPPSTSIDLPVLPAFNKGLSSVLAAFLVVLFHKAVSQQTVANTLRSDASARLGWIPKSSWSVALLLMLMLSPFLSSMVNRAPLVFERNWLPGMSLYDAGSVALALAMMILPFLLARKYLACAAGQKTLLTVLAILAGIYMLPTLFEVRMSPQLNNWVYGFFPHSWLQHIRGDGFRPVVFLQHGLWLSMFLSMGFIASLACARIYIGNARLLFSCLSIALLVTLVLTKSLGAFVIAVTFIPVMLLAGRTTQLIFASAIVSLVLLYPMLRTSALFPERALTSAAAVVSEQRAASLGTRLYHERQIMEKAMQKPLFGWGSWGRWRVYDEAGRDVTISDGRWVITLSEGGWLRFIGVFGLLSAPILISSFSSIRGSLGAEHVSLALLLAANMIDLVPNSGMTVITWLLAGSLAGRLELEREGGTISTIENQEATPQMRGALAYTRFSPMSERSRLAHRVDRQQGEKQPSRMTEADSGPVIERYSRFAPNNRMRSAESNIGTTAGSLLQEQRSRPATGIRHVRES